MKAAPARLNHLGRDLSLAIAVSQLDDAARVGVREVAAFFGVSPLTLKRPEARKALGLGEPIAGSRHLKWTVGELRAAATRADRHAPPKRQTGRPTKAQQIERAAAASQLEA